MEQKSYIGGNLRSKNIPSINLSTERDVSFGGMYRLVEWTAYVLACCPLLGTRGPCDVLPCGSGVVECGGSKVNFVNF